MATLALASLLCAAQASAQTIKVGSVLTLSGPNATLGENMDRAWHKEYGENSTPSFMSVGAWDGMDAIYYAIREQTGKVGGKLETVQTAVKDPWKITNNKK
jgi:ABC-type branched-subunit amino acid transport system substrate-binding protein